MTKSQLREKGPQTKPCVVCAEEIKSAARICTHCNSYQDWRADLSMSSTILSLLIALASILTVAVPVVMNAVTPKDSNISISFEGASETNMDILAFNSGTKPGTVRYPIYLTVSVPNQGSARIPLDFSLGVVSPAAYIDPNKSSLLVFNVNMRHDAKVEPPDMLAVLNSFDTYYNKATCAVTVTKTDFSEKTSPESDHFECRELLPLFGSIQWKESPPN